MKDALLQIAMATIGSLGFSIYFRVSERNVAASTAGGAIGWAVYLLIFHFSEDLFLANFGAAAVVYLWSEGMARALKAPSNVYLVPGIIPLIPGSALYYTMSGLVHSDKSMFIEKGIATVLATFGIAAGIVASAVFFYYIIKPRDKTKN